MIAVLAILFCAPDGMSQYTTERDGFAGVTRIRQGLVTVWGLDSLHGKPIDSLELLTRIQVARIQCCLIIAQRDSSKPEVALRFVYTGRGWMFLEPALQAKLDSIQTIGGLEPDRDVLYGDVVSETILFPISKEQLHQFILHPYRFRLTTKEGRAINLDVSKLKESWGEMYKTFIQ